MKKNLFFIALAAIIFSGCGYTTHSVLSPGEPTIHIENFINKIKVTEESSDDKIYRAYIPAMESDITREIINKFIFDGNYRIVEERNAHFLLKGELVEFRREPLRYDTNDNVTEYRLKVIVNVELYDLDKNKELWREDDFAGESTYRLSGQFAKSEQTAIDDAIKDLARRIVERTVENW